MFLFFLEIIKMGITEPEILARLRALLNKEKHVLEFTKLHWVKNVKTYAAC